MSVNNDEMLHKILDHISGMGYIKPEDIPNINLYMDQVTTFMEEHLAYSKRYKDDKILTKTMINNYAKNNLLPPPVKKKYSKEHILAMIFIYYFKNILSIKDIETMLAPITENYFDGEKDFNIASIYEEVFKMEKSRMDAVQKDVARSYTKSLDCFSDIPGLSDDELKQLQTFAFICNLSFDVYIKKHIIEKLIDDMPEPEHHKNKVKK